MLILQIWFTASILVAAFWALAGLLLSTPEPAPRNGTNSYTGASSSEQSFQPRGEAA